MNRKHGFTLIELLVVIAIIGLLSVLVIATADSSRKKAADARIRNSVSQIRWLAELVYNSQDSSFENWSTYPEIQASLQQLEAEIDEAYGGTDVTVIRDSEIQTYCVSAPLLSEPGSHYCIDAGAIFKMVSSACPDTAPFQCPSS
jgi:prepilin-type N-terminal cleavage/methylation domain-containing protein